MRLGITAKWGRGVTPDEQLEQWVLGNSLCPNDRDECCPDFSCCTPELLADENTRKAFAKANKETRMSMLGMFLGAGIAFMGKDKEVHITGFDDPEKQYGLLS